MHQVVTKKLDIGYIDHSQHSLTYPGSEGSTPCELINMQNGSVTVDGLPVAEASSGPSNNIVFRSSTTRALKASEGGPLCYDVICHAVIPRWSVAIGAGDAVLAF